MSCRKIIPYNSQLKGLAIQLQNNATKLEIKLWDFVRGIQMMGYDFNRQKPINNYILNFFVKN